MAGSWIGTSKSTPVPLYTVAIAAGGTDGHVYPAWALAEGFRTQGLNTLFIGPEGQHAERLRRHGHPFCSFSAHPLMRETFASQLRTLGGLPESIYQARLILEASGVQLVIGVGGYASAAPVLAARGLGLRTAIYECNVAPGFTNRILSRFVNRIYVSYEDTQRRISARRSIVTGHLIRPDVMTYADQYKECPPRKRPAHILVLGGSEGSPFLNAHVPELIEHLAERVFPLEVYHQTGYNNVAPVAAAYRRAGIKARVVPYIEDIVAAYHEADFAITCSGACTLAELAVVGLPALVVPLASAAANHQRSNAIAFSQATGCDWVEEVDWKSESLIPRIVPLLQNPDAWAHRSLVMRESARINAVDAVVSDCQAMMAIDPTFALTI